ncbi:hypothetical protein LguiA_001550 [Lonicera macranthoides]
MASQHLFLALAITMLALTMPVYGQITTPCTASMLTTFSPCMNFITNSTANGTAPTADCCNSLRSVMSNGTDCLCLIATGSIPFQVPINRTLAISLPRACNMPGVPLQCKAAGSPIPAPGPAALGPTPFPRASPPSPTVPGAVSPTLAPEADANPTLIPPSTTGTAGAPTTNSDSRPALTPSGAAKPSHGLSPSLLLVVLGATILKNYY